MAMRILVLGATGMLGSAIYSVFSRSEALEVWGTIRGHGLPPFFETADQASRFVLGCDVLQESDLVRAIAVARPDVVINCIGLIKQLSNAEDPVVVLPINAIFPHRLARLCALANARVVHISTDCVFLGDRGAYLESDRADAFDLYGRSKHIGELHDYPNAVTLRTSIIGHEIRSANALVDWFLSQEGSIQGFSQAIFSGLPTVELARVILEFVLPDPALSGLYHVAAAPISKLDLLSLIAEVYGKDVQIVPSDRVKIDRSLNSERFSAQTGYRAASWNDLVKQMYVTSAAWRRSNC